MVKRNPTFMVQVADLLHSHAKNIPKILLAKNFAEVFGKAGVLLKHPLPQLLQVYVNFEYFRIFGFNFGTSFDT